MYSTTSMPAIPAGLPAAAIPFLCFLPNIGMRITRYLHGRPNLLFTSSLPPLDVLRLERGLPSVATTAGTFSQKDVLDPIRTTQQGGRGNVGQSSVASKRSFPSSLRSFS